MVGYLESVCSRWAFLLTSNVRPSLANGQQAVKSFRYLLTDPCELNILLRRPGWREIGCNSIDNAVLEPVGVHDSSYACYSNEGGQSQSGYRRHDRQRCARAKTTSARGVSTGHFA